MISPIDYLHNLTAKSTCSLLLPALLLAISCSHDRETDLPDFREKNEPYVLLRIALPSGLGITRSDPAGGEEGNGREPGILNEDRIHDINVFFYRDEKGLDGDDDTEIIQSVFFNLDDPTDPHNTPFTDKYQEESSSIFSGKFLELAFDINDADDRFGEGVRFAAVANVGFIGDAVENLKQLREFSLGELSDGFMPVSNPAKSMDRFPMSTAYNREYVTSGNISTGKNMIEAIKNRVTNKTVFTGTTTLERLYARIDLWYNSSLNAGVAKDKTVTEIDRLTYPVKTGNGTAIGNKVAICNVIPVNVRQSPSFLFKKVTALDITADAPDVSWTSGFLKSVSLFSWAGKETPDGIPTSMPEDLPTNYVIEPYTLLKTPAATGNLEDWFGSTSLASVKQTVKEDREAGNITDYYSILCEKGAGDPDYGCDRISVITYANENTQPVDCFLPQYITGLAMRALYFPLYIYKEYTPAAGDTPESFTELSADDKKGYDLNLHLYRYSPSSGNQSELTALYFSRLEALEAYRSEHPSDNPIVTEYSAGRSGDELGLQCFYNLWIRHYNDEKADPTRDYPMEYAIVRNNIYRVALEFTGPGDPQPEMRETDSMMSRIWVRKWNKRTESTPMQF